MSASSAAAAAAAANNSDVLQAAAYQPALPSSSSESDTKRYISRWELKAGSISDMKLMRRELILPSQDVVQVRICSIGLNFADVFAVKGLYSATPDGTFTPGLEFAGILDAVPIELLSETGRVLARQDDGSLVETSLRLGDRVMGVTRFGAYSTYVHVDPRCLRVIPSAWTMHEGAGFICQALTAFYAVRELAALSPGQVVLVHSAAGGVGLYAVELAHAYGAAVVATVGRAEKVPVLMERTGLHRQQIIVRTSASNFAGELAECLSFIDKNRVHVFPKHAAPPRHIKVDKLSCVMDSLMGDYFAPAYAALDSQGRHIVFGAGAMTTQGDSPNWLQLAWRYMTRPRIDPLKMIAENKSVMAFNLIWLWDRIDNVGELLDELCALKLQKPHVGSVFPFEMAKRALRHFQSGATVGKVVLVVESKPFASTLAHDRQGRQRSLRGCVKRALFANNILRMRRFVKRRTALFRYQLATALADGEDDEDYELPEDEEGEGEDMEIDEDDEEEEEEED